MKKIICTILICILMIGILPTETVYGNHNHTEYLDIKIEKSYSSTEFLRLDSEDGFNIYYKTNKDSPVSQIQDKSILISFAGNEDINILDLEKTPIGTIKGDGSMIIGSGSINNSIIKIGENKYRDYMSFLIKSNSFLLINHIEIENYLYGVVPREMGSSFPMESLKAQAVAARTFAMANKNKHISEGFNLCNTTHCQVYGAINAENQNTNIAVNETKKTYIYYNGEFVDATFHSNNGGYIESSKNVWGGHHDYLVAKEDVFSVNAPSSSWELKLEADEIGKKLSAAGINLGKILDLEILEVSEANRVLKLKVKGSLGEEIITGNRLRTILGTTSMKSTWFNIIKEGDYSNNNKNTYVFDLKNLKKNPIDIGEVFILNEQENISKLENKTLKIIGSQEQTNIEIGNTSNFTGFLFQGRGYGHGVGMSQYGAMEMAKQGHSYVEILKHYYTGVDIISN